MDNFSVDNKTINSLETSNNLLNSIKSTLDILKKTELSIKTKKANQNLKETKDSLDSLKKKFGNINNKKLKIKTSKANDNLTNTCKKVNEVKDKIAELNKSEIDISTDAAETSIEKVGEMAESMKDNMKTAGKVGLIDNVSGRFDEIKENIKKNAFVKMVVKLKVFDGLKAVFDRVKGLNSTIGGKFDAIAEKWESIKSSFMDKVALGVSPELDKMADSIMNILSNINFDGVGEGIGSVLSGVARIVNDLLDQLAANPDAIKNMFQTINDAASKMGSAIETAFHMAKPLLDFIIANPGFAIGFATSILITAKTVGILVSSINAIKTVSGVFGSLKGVMTATEKTGGGSMMKLLGKIKSFGTKAIGAFQGFFSYLMANPLILVITGIIILIVLLYKAWKNNWGGMRDILTDVWDGMMAGFATGVSFFIKGINSIIDIINKIPGVEISKMEEPGWVKDSIEKVKEIKKVKEVQDEKDELLNEHLAMKNRSKMEEIPKVDEIDNSSFEGIVGDTSSIDPSQYAGADESFDYENIDTSSMGSKKNQVNYNGTININKLADQFVIKEEADVTKIIQSLVDKLTETRINFA
jgi:hypothetical protein